MHPFYKVPQIWIPTYAHGMSHDPFRPVSLLQEIQPRSVITDANELCWSCYESHLPLAQCSSGKMELCKLSTPKNCCATFPWMTIVKVSYFLSNLINIYFTEGEYLGGRWQTGRVLQNPPWHLTAYCIHFWYSSNTIITNQIGSYSILKQPQLNAPRPNPKPSLKIRTANAIFWIYLGGTA